MAQHSETSWSFVLIRVMLEHRLLVIKTIAERMKAHG